MIVANRVYLIIVETSYGQETLNKEHAHVEHTLLVGNMVEYHNHNHNILTVKPNTIGV